MTHDLESSGSGFGPDDEDTPLKPNVVFNPSKLIYGVSVVERG